MRRLAFGLGLAIALACVQAAAARTFGIEDYFRIWRITEVALSPDGRWVAYAAEQGASRQVFLQAVEGRQPPLTPAALVGARQLAWIPGTDELAYIAAHEGTPQVFSYEPGATPVRRTQSADPVTAFAFARGGSALAFATQARTAPVRSLYERFREDETAILLDIDTASVHDFVNPDWNALVRPAPVSLWIASASRAPRRIGAEGVAGFTRSFAWAPHGLALSVVYRRADAATGLAMGDVSSVGVVDLASGRLRPLAVGAPATATSPAVSYAGGEWAGETRLLLRRVVETDPWVSDAFPDLSVAPATGPLPDGTDWRTVELYPSGLRVLDVRDRGIQVETVRAGVRGLYELRPGTSELAPVRLGPQGSLSQISFSADRRRVAFVSESLTRPPEVYVRTGAGAARRLTNLNGELAAGIQFRSREVSWRAPDGATLRGWLLEPGPRWANDAPPPLVTLVHGGPAFPYPNAFAPYFGSWPYPVEAYAEAGMAVFLPNYRGTHTYGRQIAEDKAALAVGDVLSGVDALVAAGVADRRRLGISGQSNGALVGAMAMARARRFAAASFAEGVASSVVMYEMVGDEANREIHDRIYGASLYDAPERYLADSPDLQFKGLTTPSLFEGGSQGTALLMLGLPKAARRAGAPAEFHIYPRTDHNLKEPKLQREAAQRNLDWFGFWLVGREAAAPAEQYARWRAMRQQSATQP